MSFVHQLSERAKEAGQRADSYNRAAARKYFGHYNPPQIYASLRQCDLHGLFVREALEYVAEHLEKCR